MNDELLSVAGLRRSYGQLHAVNNVDWSVRAGQRHALIGCNGAGKTTLLHLLAGTVRPSAGKIIYNGRDITRKSQASRSRLGISRTFQTPKLFDTLTALENVEVGALPHGVRTKAKLAALALDQLDALGIADRASTVAGELSHGQKRLLEIAIALASGPKLLLLDEPAAGLTDADLERMLACLRDLPSDLTVVLVEHHQDLVTAIAEVVTVLHEGQVLTAGTPAEVAAHPEVAEVYLGTVPA
ncbi:MAG: ABC transporter ATP-binding protein [Stackebrandtia sp.]